MKTLVLYPELVNYIYDYECRFMTKDEITAALKMQVPKDTSFELLKLCGTPGNLVIKDDVKIMILDGIAEFKNRVATRICKEHKNELELNHVPNVLK